MDEKSADLAQEMIESTEEAERRAVALQGTQVVTEEHATQEAQNVEPTTTTKEAQAIEAAFAVAEKIMVEESKRQLNVQSEAVQAPEVEPAIAQEPKRQP